MIGDHSVGNFWSLVIAAAAGGLFAFLVGIPLMRLSGLAAGIATFAVLEITQNILGNWEKIGPGPLTLSTVPQTTDLWQATSARSPSCVVAFAYQLSPLGRKLRATREDPFAAQAAGIDVHRQRLWAFALSGALAGFAGGLFVHFQSTINDRLLPRLHVPDAGDARRRRLAQPLGRSRRRARVSGLDSFLSDAENGVVGWLHAPRRVGARSSSPRSWRLCSLPAARPDRRPGVRYPPSSSPGGRSGSAPGSTASRPQE